MESVSKYGNFKLLATSGALYIKIALKNPKQTSHFSAQRYSFTAAVVEPTIMSHVMTMKMKTTLAAMRRNL